MKFACKADNTERKTAAPAISPFRRGFTLIEVMVVIVIIGVLSSLAYSSLIDLIFTNRAKETAQVMRTFAERSLAEAKRMNLTVELSLGNGSMVAKFFDGDEEKTNLTLKQPFSDGFTQRAEGIQPEGESAIPEFEGGEVTSLQAIGFFGLDYAADGSFAVCGGRDYCGGVVKRVNKNSFEAWVKKGKNASWSKI